MRPVFLLLIIGFFDPVHAGVTIAPIVQEEPVGTVLENGQVFYSHASDPNIIKFLNSIKETGPKKPTSRWNIPDGAKLSSVCFYKEEGKDCSALKISELMNKKYNCETAPLFMYVKPGKKPYGSNVDDTTIVVSKNCYIHYQGRSTVSCGKGYVARSFEDPNYKICIKDIPANTNVKSSGAVR